MTNTAPTPEERARRYRTRQRLNQIFAGKGEPQGETDDERHEREQSAWLRSQQL